MRRSLSASGWRAADSAWCAIGTMDAIPRQLIEQPVVCRHGDAAGAPDLVGLTAQTAFGSDFFNEIFRCVDLIAECQYVVFAAQMRLRLFRVVPAAIAIKRAVGSFDKAKQVIDLCLRDRRRHRATSRKKH